MLDVEELRAELIRPSGLWQSVEVVDEAGSTNADLAAAARQGQSGGAVLLTEHQSAGRGRQGRVWTAPAGTGIAMSVLLRPADVDPARWSWLPLITGLAVADGLRSVAGVPAVLKWPNDVLVEERKICGILAERVETPTGPACVIGMGINLGLTAAQLPVPTATSLAVWWAEERRSGEQPGPTAVAATVLAVLELVYGRWAVGDTDGLSVAYAERCVTLGKPVRVTLTDHRVLEGTASTLDVDGRLVVTGTDGVRHVLSAGDVLHLRR